ncbi:MAG: ATP-binding protein [Elusimicrobiota bacterium]
MAERTPHPDGPRVDSAADRHRRAEEKVRADERRTKEALSSEDTQRLLHDLRVHQIELEVQNEELLRTHLELDASRARYFDLYDLAPIGYLALDEKGFIKEANLTAAKLLGMGRGQLARQPLSRFILPEDQDLYYRLRKPLISSAAPQACELRLLRTDSPPFWARLELVEGHELDGSPVWRVMMSDIGERKRMEAEALKMQKLDSLGVLAGGIAHDFNNMLTGILGNLALLKSDLQEGDERLELVKEAVDACNASKGLAKQLLTFASGGVPVVACVDLAALAREAAGFATRGTSVLCDVSASGDCFAKADRDQVLQVVQNLVINAVQAMPTGGSIRIDLARVGAAGAEAAVPSVGDFIRLRMTDSGTGIAKDNLPRVFDPYFSTKGKSHGLGLAMCHSIVIKHGGSISVESRAGEGCVFTVRLPAAAPSERPAEVVPAELHRGSGRVLVMEDEETVVRVLMRMLWRLGYASEAAADGEAALTLFQRAREIGTPFDAVIMDLTVAGGMGGKEAVARLLELAPGTKVLVSSGYSSDPVMADCAKYGFCGALSKPYKLEEVSAAMLRAIPPK